MLPIEASPPYLAACLPNWCALFAFNRICNEFFDFDEFARRLRAATEFPYQLAALALIEDFRVFAQLHD